MGSIGHRDPAAHRLLIASPSLTDPEFFRTVVFLIEHDDSGTVGVIINRPSRTPVGHVLSDWQDVMSEPAVVFNGGPVQREGALGLARLSATAENDPHSATAENDPHSATAGGHPVPASADIGNGLRAVSGGLALIDLDARAADVAMSARSLRVFAGHAGWSAGQLDSEVSSGGWFVVDGSLDDVFSDRPSLLWRSVLRRQPQPLSLLSTYPVDVGLN